MIEELGQLFIRDLDILDKEINEYTSSKDIWSIDKDISNSAGNLCLHICGNLQHFIGHILGGTAYTRNREFEFSAKDQSKDFLNNQISAAKESISLSFERMTIESLNNEYPLPFQGKHLTVFKFLLHLYGHLNYHLGQINYHRRGIIAS